MRVGSGAVRCRGGFIRQPTDHLVRQLTDKLAATPSNCTTTQSPSAQAAVHQCLQTPAFDRDLRLKTPQAEDELHRAVAVGGMLPE
jgi:hypothetical protein